MRAIRHHADAIAPHLEAGEEVRAGVELHAPSRITGPIPTGLTSRRETSDHEERLGLDASKELVAGRVMVGVATASRLLLFDQHGELAEHPLTIMETVGLRDCSVIWWDAATETGRARFWHLTLPDQRWVIRKMPIGRRFGFRHDTPKADADGFINAFAEMAVPRDP